MGTNSKTSHVAYTTAPTAPTAVDEAAPSPLVQTFIAINGEEHLKQLMTMNPHLTPDQIASGKVAMTMPIFDGPPPPWIDTDTAAPAIDPYAEPEPEPAEAAPAPASPDAPADGAGPVVDVAVDAGGSGPGGEDPPEPDPDILTPIPEVVPAVAHGTPVLVGGDDLTDSAATLVSYQHPDGVHEALLATVTPEAEAKLLDALQTSGTKMIPVQVEKEVSERLPVDVQHGVFEAVTAAAKSVNHKLDTGQGIPESTQNKIKAAEEALQALTDSGKVGTEGIKHYAHQLVEIKDAAAVWDAAVQDPDSSVTAAELKVTMTTPYLHTSTQTVTEYVPAPPEDLAAGQLPATERKATRINAAIDGKTGAATWDGAARTDSGAGKEYVVDLGDGYSAVYRPYAENEAHGADFSLRGKLEVHAPAGTGHGAELVERLGALNLVNAPMTAAEGEWSYLKSNITAQGLGQDAGVAAALANSAHLDDMALQEQFHAHAAKAVGLDEAGLQSLAKRLQLAAAKQALPAKVAMVRDAVAQAKGFADGAELAAHPGYQPTPAASGGWLTWSRFDVTGAPDVHAAAWKGKSLTHNLGSGALLSMFRTGVLASTERRAAMGTATGIGMSEAEDKKTGGANSVFLRVKNSASVAGHGGTTLVWDQPSTLMGRADYYGYDGDHFGAINPKSHQYSPGKLTRDPMKIANFHAHNNEVMFANGLDLLGAEAPSRIYTSAGNRTKLLALFDQRGITHLAGKPVADVVIANT